MIAVEDRVIRAPSVAARCTIGLHDTQRRLPVLYREQTSKIHQIQSERERERQTDEVKEEKTKKL